VIYKKACRRSGRRTLNWELGNPGLPGKLPFKWRRKVSVIVFQSYQLIQRCSLKTLGFVLKIPTGKKELELLVLIKKSWYF